MGWAKTSAIQSLCLSGFLTLSPLGPLGSPEGEPEGGSMGSGALDLEKEPGGT